MCVISLCLENLGLPRLPVAFREERHVCENSMLIFSIANALSLIIIE